MKTFGTACFRKMEKLQHRGEAAPRKHAKPIITAKTNEKQQKRTRMFLQQLSLHSTQFLKTTPQKLKTASG